MLYLLDGQGWFFPVFVLHFQHPGYGVDVRKRSIWDLYGDETILKVTSIFISLCPQLC